MRSSVPLRATIAAVAAMTVSVSSSARQEGVFSARAELVVLQVAVDGKDGRPAAGLDASAFRVFDEGRQQPLQFFGAEDEPVAAGLIVDNSGSMRGARPAVAAAAAAFTARSHAADEVFALLFNEHVWPVLPPAMPFTSKATVLEGALLRMPPAAGTTALWDALDAGLLYVRAAHHPRRVLVVVADGDDNASAATFDEVHARAQLSDALIYAVAVRDPQQRPASTRRLRRLAQASGGRAFEPASPEEIPTVLSEIADDIRRMYTLAYAQPPDTRPGVFRRVRVEVRGSGGAALRVRTREGYRVPEVPGLHQRPDEGFAHASHQSPR